MPVLARQRRFRLRLVASLMVALNFAGSVHAQVAVASSNDSAPEVSEVVVTASRLGLFGQATAASTGVTTHTELDLRPARRVGQLLESIPGLVVTIHSGEGKAPQYLARGFNLDHGTDIANFIDDVPINRPTNAHGQGYSDLNFVIPEILDRVEYTKGTYHASVGDFGDVASEHMRIADVIPNEISLSVGTFGDRSAYLGGARSLGDDRRLLAAIDLSHVDGASTPSNAYNKYATALRYSRGAGGDSEDLTFLYYKGDGRLITDQPARATQEGRIGRFGTLNASDGSSAERLSLSGHAARSIGPWSLAVNAYYVHSRMTLWNDFTHFLEDPVNGDQEQQDETRDLFGGAAKASLRHDVGPVRSMTTFGVQGRYDDVFVDRRHTRARKVLDYCELLNADGITATPVDVGQAACTADRVRLGDVGLFLENDTRWTGWLRTDLGVREEVYSGADRSLLPGAAFFRAPYSHDATLLQPKASIVFGPWAKTEFYLSAGRGFHSDDLRGVSGSVPLEELGGVRSAPLLVKSDGEEVGLRSNLIPNALIQVAVFNVRLASEVVYDQDQGEDQPGPPSDRYGVEVSGQYRPFKWLEFNTDLSFDHARFVQTNSLDLAKVYGQTGNRIPLAPSFIGSFGMLVLPPGPWSGGLQVRTLGPYPLLSDNSERDTGYTETNVQIGYRFSNRLNVRLDVFNLFNVKANAAAFDYTTDIHDGRGPLADHQVHPLEPISARLTLSSRF